jgi:hypothetical protein
MVITCQNTRCHIITIYSLHQTVAARHTNRIRSEQHVVNKICLKSTIRNGVKYTPSGRSTGIQIRTLLVTKNNNNNVLPFPTSSSKYPFSTSFTSYRNNKLYKSHDFSLSSNQNCSLWTASFFLRTNRPTFHSTQVTNSCQ